MCEDWENWKRKWTETLKDHHRNPFTSPTGPTVLISTEPSDIFGLFYTDTVMEDIVHQTNLYAQQTMEESQYEKWVDVTVEELKAYLGFGILMGIVKLPLIDDYWKKDPFLHYDPIASRITRDRFRDIWRYLHFVDNKTLPPPGTPGSDWLAKIRPFFNIINEQCMKLYQPQRDVSIDEAMVKFQGWSSVKQYLPMKPVKRGIKVWVLADTNVYFWNMQVYTGEYGKGPRSSKTSQYHCITTSIVTTFLTQSSWSWKSWPYACGTARSDRIGFPPQLKKIKLTTRYRIGALIFSRHVHTKHSYTGTHTHPHTHTPHLLGETPRQCNLDMLRGWIGSWSKPCPLHTTLLRAPQSYVDRRMVHVFQSSAL